MQKIRELDKVLRSFSEMSGELFLREHPDDCMEQLASLLADEVHFVGLLVQQNDKYAVAFVESNSCSIEGWGWWRELTMGPPCKDRRVVAAVHRATSPLKASTKTKGGICGRWWKGWWGDRSTVRHMILCTHTAQVGQ